MVSRARPTPALIREIADEPLEIRPDDPAVETRENTWMVSATEADVAVADVIAAVEHVARAWSRQLAEKRPGHRMTFYAWTDDQAEQLRVSARSSPPTELPFGTVYDATASLDTVARAFAAHDGVIAWHEFQDEPLGASEAERSQLAALPVWTCRLGSTA